jgi:ATP-dependent Clp protease ATP-binding subunit ClpA
VVDEEVIAEVVSKMTGVPLHPPREGGGRAPAPAREGAAQAVVSQDEAIKRDRQGDPPGPQRA